MSSVLPMPSLTYSHMNVDIDSTYYTTLAMTE